MALKTEDCLKESITFDDTSIQVRSYKLLQAWLASPQHWASSILDASHLVRELASGAHAFCLVGTPHQV